MMRWPGGSKRASAQHAPQRLQEEGGEEEVEVEDREAQAGKGRDGGGGSDGASEAVGGGIGDSSGGDGGGGDPTVSVPLRMLGKCGGEGGGEGDGEGIIIPAPLESFPVPLEEVAHASVVEHGLPFAPLCSALLYSSLLA